MNYKAVVPAAVFFLVVTVMSIAADRPVSTRPATHPASQPSETIRLRREVERLNIELAKSREEVARLRRVIVDAHLTPKATKEELDAFKVTKGMRIAQISKVLGEPVEMRKRADDDFYVWLVYQDVPVPLEKPDPTGRTGYATSGNPFLEAVGPESVPHEIKRLLIRRVAASVKDGTVTDFSDTPR